MQGDLALTHTRRAGLPLRQTRDESDGCAERFRRGVLRAYNSALKDIDGIKVPITAPGFQEAQIMLLCFIFLHGRCAKRIVEAMPKRDAWAIFISEICRV